MKAVVMAGGEGSRLRPLTINRPKPLVPVCNKPVMEYVIELLRNHGINRILVTLHYLADEIVSYFGDGSELGVNIVYSIEDEPLGTAGSVKKCEQYLDETFMIMSGDALTDFDLTEIINFHRQKGALATITLTRVEHPLEFGVVITDDEHKIRRFLEKPSWGEVFSDTINTGIYCFEPGIFDFIEPGSTCDFSKNIFPLLLEKGKTIYGYIADGYWCDIGNHQQYRQANQDMFGRKVKSNILGKQRSANIWVGDDSEIHPTAIINGPCVIGKNCRIYENARIDELTAIGDNCIIEEAATIQHSILWPNVYVGRNCRINGTTIGRQVTLKEDTQTGEGAIIGDKCYLGKGVSVNPRIKIWPDKKIESGATVSMSLVWGGIWRGSLFGVDGITGLGNIEITPEFAMKLGAAFGASHKKSTIICTSRDAHPASRLINRSFICGLSSVGINVWDLRVIPTPLSRYSIRNGIAQGGIHTRIWPQDSRYMLIELFDSRGINIDKSTGRKIENIFFREDFRRTSLDEVGDIEFPSRLLEHYTEGFFHNLDEHSIRKAGFKVVIDYAYSASSLILPVLLGKLGCETVAINAYRDAFKEIKNLEERQKSLNQLSKVVTTLKADLGILIDTDGEKLTAIDENGFIIPDNLLLSLMVLLALKASPGSTIAVPVSAPSILDRIAHDHKGTIIRTKLDARALMHTAAIGEKKIILAGNDAGAFIFPRFQPAFDAMFTFAKLLELLAGEKRELSQIINEVPPFHQSKRSVTCPFQDKGRIMRMLIEQNRDKPVEMIDGVKIHFDRSWALIVPDPTEPLIHIVGDADSREKAYKILDIYEEKIEILKQQQETTRLSRKITESGEVPSKKKDRRPGENLLPHEKSFHFWVPGRYLGKKARSLGEFREILREIDSESITYHMEREDFSSWIEHQVGNNEMAGKIHTLNAGVLSGEELRGKLIKLIETEKGSEKQ